MRHWSSLLYLDPANYGGRCQAGFDASACPSETAPANGMGNWSMVSHLPPLVQNHFQTIVDLLVRSEMHIVQQDPLSLS